MGPRVRRRRWRPGLPLEGPPGLCPARLLRIPGPGPAAGRPSAPARRAAPRFVYGAREACPSAPTPTLPGRGRVAFAKLSPAAEGSMCGVESGLARVRGEGSPPLHPPPQLSMALWLQHS